jgi:DUF971 family protein
VYEHDTPASSRTPDQGNSRFSASARAPTAYAAPMHAPLRIELIGDEVALAWSDGAESFIPMERLRAASPSAETQGERDIFGNQYGGNGPKQFPGVTVTGWERVGNYAIRFDFSDGHRTGLYAYDYLRRVCDASPGA